MDKPFEYGFEIIMSGNIRVNNEKIEKVYFFATPNGVNEEYKSFLEYKKSIQSDTEYKEKSEKEVMDDVKKIMDNFL